MIEECDGWKKGKDSSERDEMTAFKNFFA